MPEAGFYRLRLGQRVLSLARRFPPRRKSLNLRIPATSKSLIDRAAQSSGKTRADLILEAARRAAEDTLLDQAMISVNSVAYQAFLARLDAPTQLNPALQKTMRTQAPWAKS